LAFPDTGSAREDFRQQIHQLAELLRSPNGQASSVLIAAARRDEAISERPLCLGVDFRPDPRTTVS
jgi:hypothetical protein